MRPASQKSCFDHFVVLWTFALFGYQIYTSHIPRCRDPKFLHLFPIWRFPPDSNFRPNFESTVAVQRMASLIPSWNFHFYSAKTFDKNYIHLCQNLFVRKFWRFTQWFRPKKSSNCQFGTEIKWNQFVLFVALSMVLGPMANYRSVRAPTGLNWHVNITKSFYSNAPVFEVRK